MRGQARHQAVVYGSADELAASVTPSLQHALDRRERVLVVTNRANADTMRDLLGGSADQLQWLDSERWQDRLGARYEAYLASVADHTDAGRPTRVVSDQSPGEDLPLMLREYLRYEALTNIDLAVTTPVLCLWDRRRFSAGALDSVRRTHPGLIEDGRAAHNRHFVAPADYLAEGDHTLELVPPPLTEGLQPLAGPLDLAALRRGVQAWARGWELDPETTVDLVTAVHEVAANALEHGAPPVVACYWREPAGLVCEVSDAGPGPAEPLAGYRRPTVGQDRGRGLWLARQLSDLVEVSTLPPGTRVRLHVFHRPGAVTSG